MKEMRGESEREILEIVEFVRENELEEEREMMGEERGEEKEVA